MSKESAFNFAKSLLFRKYAVHSNSKLATAVDTPYLTDTQSAQLASLICTTARNRWDYIAEIVDGLPASGIDVIYAAARRPLDKLNSEEREIHELFKNPKKMELCKPLLNG